METNSTNSLPQTKHDSSALLEAVVGALPVGVSVQDSEGRLLVLNEQAALAIGDRITHLRGQIPFGVRQAGPEQIAQRRERFMKRLGGSETWLHERIVMIEDKPHTLLVTGWPVEVGEERMLVSTSIDITERKRFEEELKFLAFHDQLTGLPNRTLIQKRVDAAMRDRADGDMFALAFIDLDNFKSINDYYGHMIGDELLRAVARRIAGQTRPCDTLARISGDEFLLLIDPLEAPEQLPRLMERITGAMKEPFLIEGHELLTSATIGASIFPLHGQTYDTLQRCADSAMYHAKSIRKGSACCFDLAMNDAMIARMSMEQRLRTAVRGRHFRTYLQPKVSIGLGKIIGFEALVRWIEDDTEVMGPGGFIALATELGLIDAITHFVLNDVADCLPQFRRCFGEDISISINIAARQASDVSFMASLTDCLQAEGLNTSIILELTEDALVTERFQNQVLPRLREMGVRVSIDDFGTGFSSLSTLADITADEIKVDRTFISSIHERPRSQGILKAIESLCQALKIEVVAEGVETEEELNYLEEHTSIQLVQGYYFGKPQRIESLLETFESVGDGMKSLSLEAFLAAIMSA
ncbi:MAG: putative bifunctional diguanylate cyclase/phosphodiesterase [Bordetella sp.]|uniref:putative bifunctional diguanylate cyclase/phosphodiesterase n=1 Tax=Bordetella sp. TaxID=28081 RepID=UPI003F7C6761